jgi:hypothetical protein
VLAPALLDAALVVLFVAIGRRSHEEAGGLATTLEIATPFLISLGIGWLAARAWRAPSSRRVGLIIWLVTVAGGLVLRRTVFDRGTAWTFVVVTAIVLGVFLMGWRGFARIVEPRRMRRRAERAIVS